MAKTQNNNKTTKKIQKKREMDRETLENTMKIRVDLERLDDSETLDTSFLEGRFYKKIKDDKKAKEKILQEKKDFIIPFTILRILFILVLLAIIIFVFQVVYIIPNNKIVKVEEDIPSKKEESVIDYNYLFVGDNQTQDFNLEDLFLNNYYVKSGEKSLTSHELLDNINNYVYVYNPSHVFIQVGMNDLLEERNIDEIADNIKDIVKGIKENRSFAKVYVESIYPINKEHDDFDSKYEKIDESLIEDLNKELKDMCNSLKVTYLDVYSEISEKHQLKEKYTDDGITLNSDGYDRIYKMIRNVVDGKNEE